jgi:hypothetical protein
VLAGGHVLLGKSSFWNKRQDALWCPTHSLLRGSPAHHGRWPGRRDVNLRCVLPAACPAECLLVPTTYAPGELRSSNFTASSLPIGIKGRVRMLMPVGVEAPYTLVLRAPRGFDVEPLTADCNRLPGALASPSVC